jgi:hypothetical protein
MTRIIGAFSKIKTDERIIKEARINSDLLGALEPQRAAGGTATGKWLEAIKDLRLNPGRSVRLSEDMSFCYRWIEQCGGEIWANVNHRISHVGPFDYAIRYQGILEAKDEQNKVAASRTDVTIPDTDDIDLAYYMPLAEGLANEVSPHFGGSISQAMREDAERMRIISRRGGVSDNKLTIDPALMPAGPVARALA